MNTIRCVWCAEAPEDAASLLLFSHLGESPRFYCSKRCLFCDLLSDNIRSQDRFFAILHEYEHSFRDETAPA